MSEYRHMVDGIDVDVDGRVLHLSNAKATEKDIEAAVASFRAMLKAEAEKPPEPPPVDYRIEYDKVVAEKAVLVKEQAASAEAVKQYEAMKEAVFAIDPKATKEDIVKALEAATAMTADVKPAPIDAEPLEG